MHLLGDLAYRQLGSLGDGQPAADAELQVGPATATRAHRIVCAQPLADGEGRGAPGRREADDVARDRDDDGLLDLRFLRGMRRGGGGVVEGPAKQQPGAA